MNKKIIIKKVTDKKNSGDGNSGRKETPMISVIKSTVIGFVFYFIYIFIFDFETFEIITDKVLGFAKDFINFIRKKYG
jgi:hypothetical protein